MPFRSFRRALVGAAFLAAAAAQASVVTYQYTGASAVDGGTVSGNFGWDDSAPSLVASAYSSQYGGGFLTAQTVGGALDGTSLSLTGLTWEVFNGPVYDMLHVLASFSFVSLGDDTAQALSGTDLPANLNLADWGAERRVRISPDGVALAVDYTLTALARVADDRAGNTVPEPGTLALMPLAAFAMWGARRRRA